MLLTNSAKSYGPEIKIDLPVKKYSDVFKVNRGKSPLFFPLESLETQLAKFSNGLDKFSNGLERLETRLEPQASNFSRIEDRELSFEYRTSRDCQLTFERYCIPCKALVPIFIHEAFIPLSISFTHLFSSSREYLMQLL